MYTHICVYIIYIYIYMYPSLCIYIYIYIYIQCSPPALGGARFSRPGATRLYRQSPYRDYMFSIYVYIYIYIYIHMYVCMYVCVCVSVCLLICLFILCVYFNIHTEILDIRGFGSSRILSSRGGILTSV